jgi:hypothetical protein
MNIEEMIIANNINQAMNTDLDEVIDELATITSIGVCNTINWLVGFNFTDNELEMISHAVMVMQQERDLISK